MPADNLSLCLGCQRKCETCLSYFLCLSESYVLLLAPDMNDHTLMYHYKDSAATNFNKGWANGTIYGQCSYANSILLWSWLTVGVNASAN